MFIVPHTGYLAACQLNVAETSSPSKIEGAGGSMTNSTEPESSPSKNVEAGEATSSPSKIEGARGSMTNSTETDSSPSKIEGAGGSMTNSTESDSSPSKNVEAGEATSSPSKIEGAGGSMTTHSKHHKNISQLKYLRRNLRNNSTLAEKALWNWLKHDQVEGLRFRRQYSIDKYILDFYCPTLKLSIELDGDYHHHVNQPTFDYERDEFLRENFGIHILRFENQIVFNQPQTIINAIINFKKERDNSI